MRVPFGALRVLPIMHHPYGEASLKKRVPFLMVKNMETKDFPKKVQVKKMVETTAT